MRDISVVTAAACGHTSAAHLRVDVQRGCKRSGGEIKFEIPEELYQGAPMFKPCFMFTALLNCCVNAGRILEDCSRFRKEQRRRLRRLAPRRAPNNPAVVSGVGGRSTRKRA